MDKPKTLWDKISHSFKNSKIGVGILLFLTFIATYNTTIPFINSWLPIKSTIPKDTLLISGLSYNAIEKPYGGSNSTDLKHFVIKKSFGAKITLSIIKKDIGSINIQSIKPVCDNILEKRNFLINPIDADQSPVFGTSTPDIFNIIFLNDGTKIGKVTKNGNTEVISSGDILDGKQRQVITLNNTTDLQHLFDIRVSNHKSNPCKFKLIFLVDMEGTRFELQYSYFTITS